MLSTPSGHGHSTRSDPIAPASYSPAIITPTGLWYLAQISTGTALDHITTTSP